MLALIFACIPLLCADATAVGITLNGTSGEHVVPSGAQTVPLVPLPMIEIERVSGRVRVRAEVVPPIGPVHLAAQNPWGSSSSEPRLSFLSGELMYALPRTHLSLGLGESIINQRTSYPPSPLVQASRVVGARYIGEAPLYSYDDRSLNARLAISPSMHGVQYSGFTLPRNGSNPGTLVDAERGSMVDASLRWTHRYAHGAFSYGIRYINYAAAYDKTNRLADRNHLLMPFAGYDFVSGRSESQSPASNNPIDPPAFVERANRTIVGADWVATSGYRRYAYSRDVFPTTAALVPNFRMAHDQGNVEIRAQGVWPRSGANPYGDPSTAWSELHVDTLYRARRIAVGLGDEIINQHLLRLPRGVFAKSRAEGLRYTVEATVWNASRGALVAGTAVVPYLHGLQATTTTNRQCPSCSSRTFVGTYRGSLVEGSLTWLVPQRGFTLRYGLRYLHKVVEDGRQTAVLTHDVGLLPFIGLEKQL